MVVPTMVHSRSCRLVLLYCECEYLGIDFCDITSTAPYTYHKREKLFSGETLEFWNCLYRKILRSKGIHRSPVGPLLTLLAGTGDCKATDPRDKVFSLFDISDEGLEPMLGLT
jgi:hypothetical protein